MHVGAILLEIFSLQSLDAYVKMINVVDSLLKPFELAEVSRKFQKRDLSCVTPTNKLRNIKVNLLI